MKVNGQIQEIKEPLTLRQYLEQQGYDCGRVAVEKNGEIVRKSQFGDVMLSDADTLEIVHFVGGG